MSKKNRVFFCSRNGVFHQLLDPFYTKRPGILLKKIALTPLAASESKWSKISCPGGFQCLVDLCGSGGVVEPLPYLEVMLVITCQKHSWMIFLQATNLTLGGHTVP